MTRPDLDAIRARNLVDWTGNGKEELSGDVAALLAYIDELERDLLHERATFESCNRARQHCEHECATLKARTTYTVGETEWAQRIAVAEQRFADEHDAHQETRTLLTDLYMKQLRADAAQMREYGLSYEGVRKVLRDHDDGEISFGKLMDLIRAAARAMAEDDRRAASNLLAIIHGDGGHYEDAHGTVKACKDAEGVVSDLRLKLDAATHALGLLYEETTDPSRCTVELYAGDYRHCISEPCRVAVKNALQQRSLGEKLRHLLPQDWNKPDGVEGLE